MKWEFQTPAKINTQLHILKKRPDGFHELAMHMIPINLFDVIQIQHNEKQGIRLTVDHEALNEEGAQSNLLFKTAKAFQGHTGIAMNYDIVLQKNIPVGAGLGGGSGNAAGLLQVLNRLHDFPLPFAHLQKVALSLGSDVPFFLAPQPSQAYGRGESLKFMERFPKFHMVVIKPEFSISTQQAYGQCVPDSSTHQSQTIHTLPELVQSLHNQFEPSLFEAFPELSSIKDTLLDRGALGALVSGSGSAVFGVFENEKAQKKAARSAALKKQGSVFCCQSIYQYQYSLTELWLT